MIQQLRRSMLNAKSPGKGTEGMATRNDSNINAAAALNGRRSMVAAENKRRKTSLAFTYSVDIVNLEGGYRT